MAERRHLRLTPACRLAALVLPLLVFGQQGVAAELGEPSVRSHIGQPLVADIELTALADPAQLVQVRLARPDVYQGAGLRLHPVLRNMRMSVMARDGRQFLHVTTTGDVDKDALHLFLELTEAGQSQLRQVTLWLTPDPNPAPVPLPAPAPLPLAAPAAVAPPSVPSPVAAVRPSQALPAVQPDRAAALGSEGGAGQAAPGHAARAPAMSLALVSRPAPPRPAASLAPAGRSSAGGHAAPASRAAPGAPGSAAAARTGKASAGPARDARPPACSGGPDSTCRTLDYKNSLLSARIVELEDKVRQLHQSVTGQADPAALPPGPATRRVDPKGAAAAAPVGAARLDQDDPPFNAGPDPVAEHGSNEPAPSSAAASASASASAAASASAMAAPPPASPPSMVDAIRARVEERKAKEAANRPPWLAIGLVAVGLALLAGAAFLHLRKRKQAKAAALAAAAIAAAALAEEGGVVETGEEAAQADSADLAGEPVAGEAERKSLWASLLGRLRRTPAATPAAPAEPVLEEAEPQ